MIASRLLVLLMLANVLNFFDRNAPSILIGPIQQEFGLNDLEIGVLSAGFTVVYALCGLPLGRLADRARRGRIIGVAMVAWSLCTAATGVVTGFASLLVVRLGVGVGEAAAAPAANSIIAEGGGGPLHSHPSQDVRHALLLASVAVVRHRPRHCMAGG